MAGTKFIPFVPLKQRVSILQIAELAGLKLVKQKNKGEYRCACPVHGGERTLVINTDTLDDDNTPGVYKCHASGDPGGDKIGLLAHCRGTTKQFSAANDINEAFPDTPHKEATVPEETSATSKKKEEGSSQERGFRELPYLEPENPAVTALGISPEVANALGLGYSPRGVHRGRIAIPMRLADGSLAGYLSITADTSVQLPPKWHL